MSGVTSVRQSRKAPPMLVLAVLAAAGVAAVAAFHANRPSNRSPSAPASTVRWQTLPRAPIAGRLGEAVAWTGQELIVAGGVTRRADGTNARVADAAAYAPATGEWRRLASPPSGVGTGAVWTGTGLLTWTGNSPDGPAVGAAYDPGANRWRRLPTGPLGVREGNANLWTGRELLVIGGHSGDGFATPIAAAFDPAAGSWRRLPGLYGLTLAGGPTGAVWNGHEAYIAGSLSLCPEQGTACGRSRPILVAYDPMRDRMQEVAFPRYSGSLGTDTAASPAPIAWTGSAVVFRAFTPGSLRVLTYRPASGRWQIGPEAPRTLPHDTDTQTVWIGDRLVAPSPGGLQIYDPKAGSWQWRPVAPGVSPLATRTASATAWTGRKLVVWSGVAFERYNPTPASGAVLLLGR